jgi:rubredoxin
VCEIGVCEDFADIYYNILADWKAAMPRKSRNPNFERTQETLREHSFEVVPFAAVPGGILVSKYGAAAVLVAAQVKDAPATFAVRPGALVRGQVARLLDRGYQKFIKTSQFELPATAAQLEAIHRFSEELNSLTGTISLYNESLGTTSDLYEYDRLEGREDQPPTPQSPWELAGDHCACRKADQEVVKAMSVEPAVDTPSVEASSALLPIEPAHPNRRAHSRYGVDASAIVYLVKTGSRIQGHLLDVSLSGCRIQTRERITVGIYRQVEVEFNLEGLPRPADRGNPLHRYEQPQARRARAVDSRYRGEACPHQAGCACTGAVLLSPRERILPALALKYTPSLWNTKLIKRSGIRDRRM